MAYLIGTDEAGYGPFLGPLVVAATVWEVPPELLATDLYDSLAPRVQRTPRVLRRKQRSHSPPAARGGDASSPVSAIVPHAADRPLLIADSKLVYRSHGTLSELERGLFAALASLNTPCTTWRVLLHQLADIQPADLAGMPWFADYDAQVPCAASQEEIESACELFAMALGRAQIRLVDVRCRLIFPHDFNQGVAACGNKATLLSRVTIDLVRQLVSSLPGEEFRVTSDKHGGRNRYASLLQSAFPENLVIVETESRKQSGYRLTTAAEQRVQWSFCQGAEAMLPAALASMVAKYLREQSMIAFNSFWQDRLPGLRPTAGYPQDARRFREDIVDSKMALGISDHLLWRNC